MVTSFKFDTFVVVFICCSKHQLGNSQRELATLNISPVNGESIDLPPWVIGDSCKFSEEKCQVLSPGLGPTIDLSPLKHPSHYSISSTANTTTLLVNVCDRLRGTVCSQEDILGACVIQDGNGPASMSAAGAFSRQLFWDRGLVKMLYLPTAGTGMTTVFVFPCDPEELTTGRYSMTYNNDSLQFDVVWYTNLTCLPENQGILRTDFWLYNMSSLTKLGGDCYNVVIEESQEIIYFNLFKALPLGPGNCDPGTMACLRVTGRDDVLANTIPSVRGVDLGRRIVSFQKVANHTVELVYGEGDQCPFCPYTKLSTRFLFSCSAQEVGPLVAGMADDNCQLVIEWYSRHACPVNLTYHVSSPNGPYQSNQSTGGSPNSSELRPDSPGGNATLSNLAADVDPKFNGSNAECPLTEADVLTTCGVPLLATGVGSFITGVLLTFCCLALYYCLCLPLCCPRGARCCRTGDEPADSCCCGLVGVQTTTPSVGNRSRDMSLGSRRRGRIGGYSVGEARANRLAKLNSPVYRSRRELPADSVRLGHRDPLTSVPNRARFGCL